MITDYIADQRVFKKTKEEKAKLHTVKKNWERTMKLFYGKNWRKHNNYPFTLVDI
jgi:hypothetical protein